MKMRYIVGNLLRISQTFKHLILFSKKELLSYFNKELLSYFDKCFNCRMMSSTLCFWTAQFLILDCTNCSSSSSSSTCIDSDRGSTTVELFVPGPHPCAKIPPSLLYRPKCGLKSAKIVKYRFFCYKSALKGCRFITSLSEFYKICRGGGNPRSAP